MHELLGEYMRTATNLRVKIRNTQSSLTALRGEQYFLAQKQITQLEEMYTEVCWTIRDIANYLK